MLRSARPRRVSACCCCGGPSAGASRRSYALPPPPPTATPPEPTTLPPPPASLPGSPRQPRKAPDAAPDFGSRPSPFIADEADKSLGVPPKIAPLSARLTYAARQQAESAEGRVKETVSKAVSLALPPSSFQDLLSRARAHLADPELAQPDPHAAHSEVGRAFVGELRDADGNVVEGRRLANLALRLGAIGLIKREMGAVEKISFLPDADSPSPTLPVRDRFNLTLASVPPLPPPTPLRSHPLTRDLLYLPPQPGYAFALQLPRWSHESSRAVGGPSLEEVVLLGTGHDGDNTGDVHLIDRYLPLSELVDRERTKGDALVPAPDVQPQSLADGPDAPNGSLDAKGEKNIAMPSPAPSEATSSSSTGSKGEAADGELSEGAEEARERAIQRSLAFTVVLTPLSAAAVRPASAAYPPSLTFAHPYEPITNATHFRAFETRLWPALRTFAGFGGGLDRARSAMIRRLGAETVTGSVEEERRKMRDDLAAGGGRPAWKGGGPERSDAPHLEAPRVSFLAPRTPPSRSAASTPAPRAGPPPSLSAFRLKPQQPAPPSPAGDRPSATPVESAPAPPPPPVTPSVSKRDLNESTYDLPASPPSTAEPVASAVTATATEDDDSNNNNAGGSSSSSSKRGGPSSLDHLYEERPPVRPYLSVPSLVAEEAEAAATAATATEAADASASSPPGQAAEAGARQPASAERSTASEQEAPKPTATPATTTTPSAGLASATSWLSKLISGGSGGGGGRGSP